MASFDQKYCSFVVFFNLISQCYDTKTGVTHHLKCIEGNNVSFECPCCPEEFNECRFKKLFQGGYVARDGVLSNHQHRYQFNEHKTHITLKECNEDDEGTYVWMCGKCNVNKQFQLKVEQISEKMLHCTVGGDISFERPCVEELDSCRFMKLEQEEFIVRDGVLNVQHPKYQLDEERTQVTLKGCNEDDEGTYVWRCGKCDITNQFHLKVQNLGSNQQTLENRVAYLSSYASVGTPHFILLVIGCFIYFNLSRFWRLIQRLGLI